MDQLSDKIRKEHLQPLATVVAGAVTFYRAEIDDDDETFMHDIKRLSEILHECKRLVPWRKLSTYFREGPPAGKVYIIFVQTPEGEWGHVADVLSLTQPPRLGRYTYLVTPPKQ